MAIDFKGNSYAGSFPSIWRGECKILPGGFKLLQSFASGITILRGALAYANFDTMEGAVIKIAKVLSGGTTSKARVQKGHYFNVGDTLMKIGVADKSPMVKSIDTSNEGYDVIELSSAIAGLTAGDMLQESTEYAPAVTGDDAKDAVSAEPKYTPNMVVGADLTITGKGLPALDLAYEAVVLKSNTHPIPSDWLIDNSPCLKTNPNILFINQ